LDISSIWRDNEHVLYEAGRAPYFRENASGEYGISIAYVYNLFNRRYGRVYYRHVASHVPILLNRTIMNKIRIEWKDEFDEMFRNKPFRTEHDMQFQFTYQQYIRHHYPFVMASEPHVHFVGAKNDEEKNIKTFEKVLNRPHQFLCLQDDFKEEPSDVIVKQIHDFYEEVYPYEAAWELDATGILRIKTKSVYEIVMEWFGRGKKRGERWRLAMEKKGGKRQHG